MDAGGGVRVEGTSRIGANGSTDGARAQPRQRAQRQSRRRARVRALVLPKLLDTRSFDGTTTLLHYLVAHLESRDEDLLSFAAEIPHLDRAARLTFAMVEEELAPLGGGLAALETELEAAEARAVELDARNAAKREAEAKRRVEFATRMARGSPRDILGSYDEEED